jgi:hypothetical protein
MAGGRPTKYKPEYCEAIIDFFNVSPTRTILETVTRKDGSTVDKEIEIANDLPTIQRFCFSIDIVKDTLHEWVARYPEFSDAYKRAKELQEDMWVRNSLKGLYNPSFTIFTGKNIFGWRDKQDIEHSGSIDRNLSDEQLDAIISRAAGETSKDN